MRHRGRISEHSHQSHYFQELKGDRDAERLACAAILHEVQDHGTCSSERDQAPLQRIRILSQLHTHIQDQFNAFGVQIMSPHFFDQPAEAVVVPKSKWFAAPAQKG